MKFIDALFGRSRPDLREAVYPNTVGLNENEITFERYEYLIRTVLPETIEQMHAGAFAMLTSVQRARVFDVFVDFAKSPDERPTDSRPATLAEAATRAELQNPGVLARIFGGNYGYTGLGGSLMTAIVGHVIRSELALAFFGAESFDAESFADLDAPAEA